MLLHASALSATPSRSESVVVPPVEPEPELDEQVNDQVRLDGRVPSVSSDQPKL